MIVCIEFAIFVVLIVFHWSMCICFSADYWLSECLHSSKVSEGVSRYVSMCCLKAEMFASVTVRWS